ncbi:MlaD family protein [Methylococcus sp. EFPC2]|uniref:MlaD family protein n=1 Tax=Methylococcus sp. EFPC2 TaxID=2812648 RepID=UPI001967996A|nr:MlaD family protein [Methylococcus sp. EFPC2]QSA97825.1 MCE family protein [Methylococcus sp. EFPC2]
MSKPVNSTAIGAFLLGGLLLLIAGLLVFGGGELFKERREFLIYFDSSLNGLNVGAPVKMQGVQVGTVKDIVLQMDEANKRVLKPVVIEFEPAAFIDLQGQPIQGARTEETQRRNVQKLIDAGFRARLEMQSLLTGLLYVDLDFYPDKPARLVGIDYHGLRELPSIPTTTDELKNAAEEVVNQIRKLPLEEMVKDLSATLKEIRDIVKSDETLRSRKALTNTLEETEKLIVSFNRQAGPLLKETHDTVKETRILMQDFRTEVRPVLTAAERAMLKATAVLEDSRGAITAVESAAGPDAPLHQALIELRDAARSIRDLTDYLERHPDSLLYGKP